MQTRVNARWHASNFFVKLWSRALRVGYQKLRTCSSKVNLAASSLALSSGRSNEKIFFPAMASSSSAGEFSSGVVAGVNDGVSSPSGRMWMAACFKSMCLMSSVGLALPRLMVSMVDQTETVARNRRGSSINVPRFSSEPLVR